MESVRAWLNEIGGGRDISDGEALNKMMNAFFDYLSSNLRRLFNLFGVDIYRKKKLTLAGLSYEAIKPSATFAPWNMDLSFQETYSIAKDFTYVDQYRCYELWSLVKQSQKLNQGALIEIGVWRGGSGTIIAQQAKNVEIPDPVYLCDTFRGVVKAGSEDITFYKGGEHADTSIEIVKQLMNDKVGLDNVKILEGVFPDDTAHLIPCEQFRFCHIDVDTYQSAKDIFDWVWARLVFGGIVVFDDYGFKFCEGVTKYVNEIKNLPDRLFIHNLNGHAIIIKTHE